MRDSFREMAALEGNRNWERLISRETPLYGRSDDIRSDFGRDYTRILHSLAFRRLRHKTQVFFNAEDNDHICTRIEHVLHVESVSTTIADYLGLNSELTRAIAMAHDLGHAPFGHLGEKIISRLTEKYLGEKFWHERNGLHFVSDVELLEDNKKTLRNLNLTYAVRDGIISHCGEVDKNALFPRSELFDLDAFTEAGAFEACTWEGCVVKFADKVAYLGRDIEDARRLDLLNPDQLEELQGIAMDSGGNAVNTTVIMHSSIIDLCRGSSPDRGLVLSDEAFDRLTQIKQFNYKNIYLNEKLLEKGREAQVIIDTIFDYLRQMYQGNAEDTVKRLRCEARKLEMLAEFADFLSLRTNGTEPCVPCENRKIYLGLENEKLYIRAVIDFIAGMTDSFAGKFYERII